MLKPYYTNKFKKDYAKAIKRGISTTDVDDILKKICSREKLELKHKDHLLIGNYDGCRECHIKNDYLLIYSVSLKQ